MLKKNILSTITAVLVMFIPTAVKAAQTLLWSDEFDGTSVDTTKWQVMDVADGTDSWFKPANVSVANGVLSIACVVMRRCRNSKTLVSQPMMYPGINKISVNSNDASTLPTISVCVKLLSITHEYLAVASC